MTRVKLESIFNALTDSVNYADRILATMAEAKGKREVRREQRREIEEFIIGECDGTRYVTDIFYEDDLLIRTMINPTFSRGMMTKYPGDTYSVYSYRGENLNGIAKDYSTKGLIERLVLFSNVKEVAEYSFNKGKVSKLDFTKTDKSGEYWLLLKELPSEDIEFLKLNAPEVRFWRLE